MITGPTFPGGALRTWAESVLSTPRTDIFQHTWRVLVLSLIVARPEPCGGPLGTDAALVSLAVLTALKCFGVEFVVGVFEVVAFVVGTFECELPHPAAIASSAKTAKARKILKIAHGTGASGASTPRLCSAGGGRTGERGRALGAFLEDGSR